MIDEVMPMRTKTDCKQDLTEVERLWEAKSRTSAGDQLDIQATLIDACEAERFPMDPLDPVEAIQFRIEQQGLTHKDVEPLIGTRTRAAKVLNRKRNLSIAII